MENQIIQQLHAYYNFFNSLNGAYCAWAKKHGLSYHKLFVLYAIYRGKGSCSQKKICEEWLIPKQTVNTILKSLEKDHYVSYQLDEADKRNKWISFTEEGLAYAMPILSELYKLESSVIEQLGLDCMDELIAHTKRYYELFQTMQEETT